MATAQGTLWTALQGTEDRRGHVAIDGNRLRGSQRETSPGIRMLSAFSVKLQAAVGPLIVPPIVRK